MIRLTKGESPASLKKNAKRWLDEFKAALKTNDKKKIKSAKGKYNQKDVKQALIGETGGKCAYCEADVLAVAHGDIEHIFPKSLDVDRTFDWANLTFACQICNQNKSNNDPNHNSIVDPYLDDPRKYIAFVGPFPNGKGSAEGIRTISLLQLDRAALIERRLEVLRSLNALISNIHLAPTPELKEALKDDFERNELGDQKEFAAMRRDVWEAYGSGL